MEGGRSYVFTVFEFKKGKVSCADLLAVHSHELEADRELRVYDRLRLRFPLGLVDSRAAAQIHRFVSLQSLPLWFVLSGADSERGLAFLKFQLDQTGLDFGDGVSFAVLPPNCLDLDVPRFPRDTFEAGNLRALYALKQRVNLLNFIETVKSQPFKDMPSVSPIPSVLDRHSEDVETVISVHFEATDLDSRKITEVSMVAISKQKLLDSLGKGLDFSDCDVLNLLVDPGIEIDPNASERSNLTRDMIAGSRKRPFDLEVATLLSEFLLCHPKPCLLAHAGQRFDFVVLATHMYQQGELFQRIKDVQTVDAFTGYVELGCLQPRTLEAMFLRFYDEAVPEDDGTALRDVLLLLKIVAAKPGIFRRTKSWPLSIYLPE